MPNLKSQRVEDLVQGVESLLTQFSLGELLQAILVVAYRKAQKARGDNKLFWITKWAMLRLMADPEFSVALDLYEAECDREEG